MAKTVFLGKVPDAWYGGRQKGIVRTLGKRARESVKRKIKASYITVHKNAQLGYLQNEPLEGEGDVPDESDAFSNKNAILTSQLKNIAFTNDNITDFADSDTENDANFRESFLETDSMLDSPSNIDHVMNIASTPETSSLVQEASPILSVQQTNPQKPPSQQGPETKVHFDESVKKSEKKDMNFIAPVPECGARQTELDDEIITAEKKRYRTLAYIRSLAGGRKGPLRLNGRKKKSKVVRKIVKSFKPGEIVQVNKMLAQMRKADSYSSVEQYTEMCSIDTRITDRWREYYVVLRKTDSASSPLVVQLYDINKQKDLERKADHQLALTEEATAGFFSNSDKTISIVVPTGSGLRIAILNARFETLAFRWLYLLKEIVADEVSTAFNIAVPGLDLKVRLFLPEEISSKIANPCHLLKVEPLKKGYQVHNEPAQEFLKSRVLENIKAMAQLHEPARKWLEESWDPWFCFRFYDRLEWVGADSQLFFVQNKIHNGKLQLELRHRSRPPLSVSDEVRKMTRPYPVEGFLARITDTAGKEVSHLRYFYKILYFCTVEHMLFFTKFFKAAPPSEFCAFNYDDPEKAKAAGQIHGVYTSDPFQVDAEGHVPWLGSKEFESKDRHVIEEFQRRILQVATAEAVIDLMEVRSIKALPFKISLHNHYFHSLLWHSSPTIVEEEELLDCGFEIELYNGSTFKVMASSSVMRDEWVRRLLDISNFYKAARDEQLKEIKKVRQANIDKLHIREYIDSNIINEYHGYETNLALAQTQMFDRTALAMESCVLHSGYLFQKHKKHASFSNFYVTLCPGYLILFTLAKRSLSTGMLKDTPCYEHYLSIPVSECYIYAGNLTDEDLIHTREENIGPWVGHAPRIYPDGWRSSEEDTQLCFTLWFGRKRKLRRNLDIAKNPHMVTMIRKLGITGKSMVFMARSRQEREAWVQRIHLEINRFSH